MRGAACEVARQGQIAAFNLGIILEERGDIEGAIQEYRHAADNPDLSERAGERLRTLTPTNA